MSKKLPKLSPPFQNILALIIVFIVLLYPLSYIYSLKNAEAKRYDSFPTPSLSGQYPTINIQITSIASESQKQKDRMLQEKEKVQNKIYQMLKNIQEYGNRLNNRMFERWNQYID